MNGAEKSVSSIFSFTWYFTYGDYGVYFVQLQFFPIFLYPSTFDCKFSVTLYMFFHAHLNVSDYISGKVFAELAYIFKQDRYNHW